MLADPKNQNLTRQFINVTRAIQGNKQGMQDQNSNNNFGQTYIPYMETFIAEL